MPLYKYRGYEYDPTHDGEPGECLKIIHGVIGPKGENLVMDWSPFQTPEEADFRLWVELGCPGRGEASSPLRRTVLLQMAERQVRR